ncbi:MAG: MptD family putative ECF transporter S component [Kiritimatiellales bacterium]
MKKPFYWKTEDLIVVGLFTALNRVASLLVSLLGGGMNPITMILKNAVSTALLIVLVSRVRRFGILVLYTLISHAVGFLVSGGYMISLLPAFLLSGLICDTLIAVTGGYRKLSAVVFGMVLYDLLGRLLALSFSWLVLRESPAMFMIGAAIVAVGYIGCLLIGVPCGIRFVKELRHAGIIREI